MTPVRILGIDPGSLRTGYGVIEMHGNHVRHVSHGTIRTSTREWGPRLLQIFEGISGVVEEFTPAEVAIEKVFIDRNADSALKLGQARGAAMTACARTALPIHEYSPNQIKLATVGRGHAQKQQVQHMIRVILCLPQRPAADAADALAAAICHGHLRLAMLRTGTTGVRRGRVR